MCSYISIAKDVIGILLMKSDVLLDVIDLILDRVQELINLLCLP